MNMRILSVVQPFYALSSTPVRVTKNSVVYEIISSLPLPAENSTLDSGADDLATLGPVSELADVSRIKSPKWLI